LYCPDISGFGHPGFGHPFVFAMVKDDDVRVLPNNDLGAEILRVVRVEIFTTIVVLMASHAISQPGSILAESEVICF